MGRLLLEGKTFFFVFWWKVIFCTEKGRVCLLGSTYIYIYIFLRNICCCFFVCFVKAKGRYRRKVGVKVSFLLVGGALRSSDSFQKSTGMEPTRNKSTQNHVS